MIILILENAPAGLKGHVSQILFRLRTDVFIGNVSAMVRDELWIAVETGIRKGFALMAFSSNTEQGFSLKICGSSTNVQKLFDLEGILLVSI